MIHPQTFKARKVLEVAPDDVGDGVVGDVKVPQGFQLWPSGSKAGRKVGQAVVGDVH